MENQLLLVDGFNLVRRIYEAGPGDDLDGLSRSCNQSLQRALGEHRPTHCAIVFDSHDDTWRHRLYSDYKADRKPTPQFLLDHLVDLMLSFKAIGFASLICESYEADDVIATMARAIGEGHGEVKILSTDSAFLQLLQPHIRVFDHFKHRELDEVHVNTKFGVTHTQLIDFWAIAGDRSNYIKGVPGVGDKGAARLLGLHGTLEAMLEIDPARVTDKPLAKVQEHRLLALRCQQLVTLKQDVEVGVKLRDFRLSAEMIKL